MSPRMAAVEGSVRAFASMLVDRTALHCLGSWPVDGVGLRTWLSKAQRCLNNSLALLTAVSEVDGDEEEKLDSLRRVAQLKKLFISENPCMSKLCCCAALRNLCLGSPVMLRQLPGDSLLWFVCATRLFASTGKAAQPTRGCPTWCRHDVGVVVFEKNNEPSTLTPGSPGVGESRSWSDGWGPSAPIGPHMK